MEEKITSIMNTINISIVGDKIKIKTDPERSDLPIDVVETIIENVMKQCAHVINKDDKGEELIEAKAMIRSWRIVSFILMLIIIGLLIWRR